MKLSGLEINRWRQFESVTIDLSRDVVVLTGPNGCGKTTILNLIAKHFGWDIGFISSLEIDDKEIKKIYSDFKRQMDEEDAQRNSPKRTIGRVTYSDGSQCTLSSASRQKESKYSIAYDGIQQVDGMIIPSHRPPVTYHKIENISTAPKETAQHYTDYQNILMQTYGSVHSHNPMITIKSSLISLAVFGFGNQVVQSNREYRDFFNGFVEVLSAILPESIGFKKIKVASPDIILETKTINFNIDSMSGGIHALFSIAWQIYTFSINKGPSTIIIDEPENHLHPSMQKDLIPSLKKAFPGYRFILATHSPFIITSDESASVYGLLYQEDSKFGDRFGIVSHKLDPESLAMTPNRILKDILMVSEIVPKWVEDKIKSTIRKHAHSDGFNAELAYQELVSLGLIGGVQ